MNTVRCIFYIRTLVEGRFRFDPVAWKSYEDDGYLCTAHPPDVGDNVTLPGGGEFRVVARSWMYAQYGSTTWPEGNPEPIEGPQLDLIVEEVPGIFVDR